MDAQLDNLSVTDLLARYQLGSKQSIYNRLDAAGIKPQKGKINADQLQVMDLIDRRLQSGETLQDIKTSFQLNQFSNSSGLALDQSSRHPVDLTLDQSSGHPVDLTLDQSSGQLPINQLLQLVELLANHLKQPPHPLQVHRDLQEAAENNLLLSTWQLRTMLGQRPKEGSIYGYQIRKDGRSGKGQELGWRVSKG